MAVIETIGKRDHSQAQVRLDRGPITVSDLRLMYAFLRSEEMISKADDWNSQGGLEGLRWSHRILRQHGHIKASPVGDVTIPEVIDISLGPNVIAAFSDESVDELSKKFLEAGVQSAFTEIDGGTICFFAGNEGPYKTTKSVPHIPAIKATGLTVVETNRSRTATILKSVGNRVVGMSCEHLTNAPEIPGASIVDAYLLKFTEDTENHARVLKVDETLGLVLGWAIICKIDGQPYFDTQGDHIPEESMMESTVDFMMNSRLSKEMHIGEGKGTILFAWPMTEEVAKAFGITTSQTGLMIALKPSDPAILEKFRDGTYTGFSIGGSRIPEHTEEVADA